MGEDLKALAKEWCLQKKIFYIHARNLAGTRDHFLETFQDNGAINLGEMFQTYNGFRGPVRPDHDPIMDGEPGDHPGYGNLGRSSPWDTSKASWLRARSRLSDSNLRPPSTVHNLDPSEFSRRSPHGVVPEGPQRDAAARSNPRTVRPNHRPKLARRRVLTGKSYSSFSIG